MTGRASALVGLLAGAAFYLLLIDTVSAPELYAGAGATVLAGIAFEVSREQGFAEASFRLAWFARGWRLLWQIPVAIVLVAREALVQLVRPRRSRGAFRAIHFVAGAQGSGDVGRRAVAEAIGSLAPNTIVIGIDPDHDLLLVHQLGGKPDPERIDVLGLG